MPDHPSWPAELVEKGARALDESFPLGGRFGGDGGSWSTVAHIVLSALSGDLVPRSLVRELLTNAQFWNDETYKFKRQADELAGALEENRQMSDDLLSLLVGIARQAIEHREPEPGDLVVEITTLRLPPDPDAIGLLVAHDDAPYHEDDPLDGSVPMREVWDIRPLSGRSQPGRDFQRWENAEFWPVRMSPHIEAALASYRSSSSTETEG